MTAQLAPTASEARRNLLASAALLRRSSRDARNDGYTHWSKEYADLARIAFHAARAERTDPDPPLRICHVCGGLRWCVIAQHRSVA